MGRCDRKKFLKLLNALGLLYICVILGSAFYFQWAKHELPCPLCLLQRLGLLLAGFGFYFNLRLKTVYSHYSLVIFSAILTSAIATRQILLHIAPGDPGYGSMLFGLHFYTWSLISSVFVMLIVVGIIILNDLSRELYMFAALRPMIRPLEKIICVLFALIILANLIFAFLECGTGGCPDNPTSYFFMLK